MQEDSALVNEIMLMRTYARAKELIERPDTDEDTLAKTGLPDALITAVMDNIEKAAQRGSRPD